MSGIVTRRSVTPDDDAFLQRVYAATRTEELAVVPWEEAEKEALLRMQFEAQDRWYREHYTGATYEVVFVDGEPAGRLYVHRREREIRIMDIALLPEHRGNGVGSSLVRDLLAEAETAGKRVTIHVERLNPALRLYRRLGFTEVADRGVYLLLEAAPYAKTAS